jgi:UPF0271 protein
LPDLAGFGRRELRLAPHEAEDLVLYQVAAVAGVAGAEGVRLQHVKAHGALYNMAARDPELAAAIVRAVAAFDRSLIVFGPPRSALIEAALAGGLRTAAEAFADRAYEPDGGLTPRDRADAVIDDPAVAVPRAVRLVTTGSVAARDGTPLPVVADTLCLHGDTRGAAVLGARLRAGLRAAGVDVRAVGAP